ncbi:MAG: hypothetical protein LBG78_06080 [Azoarcus sp.]|jgi:hypothetical protein|nr:hypothetical protein [Azoarcus sp.]
MSIYPSFYDRYAAEADAYAQQFGLGPRSQVSGDWDAFRHAYASAEMTREYGETLAKWAGWLKEWSDDLFGQKPSDV